MPKPKYRHILLAYTRMLYNGIDNECQPMGKLVILAKKLRLLHTCVYVWGCMCVCVTRQLWQQRWIFQAGKVFYLSSPWWTESLLQYHKALIHGTSKELLLLHGILQPCRGKAKFYRWHDCRKSSGIFIGWHDWCQCHKYHSFTIYISYIRESLNCLIYDTCESWENIKLCSLSDNSYMYQDISSQWLHYPSLTYWLHIFTFS